MTYQFSDVNTVKELYIIKDKFLNDHEIISKSNKEKQMML